MCSSDLVGIGVMFLQAKESHRLLENLEKLGENHGTDSPSQPSEGISSANILISDFQLLEVRGNKFLLFKPFGLWYFLMATTAN